MNITELLGEATEYDKKQAVEMKKPKSWLKSISAFANGVGGTLIFGIADDETIVGIKDTKVASDYMFEDYSFTKLRERYKEWTGNSMSEKAFESFGLLEAMESLPMQEQYLLTILQCATPDCFAQDGMVLIKAVGRLMR